MEEERNEEKKIEDMTFEESERKVQKLMENASRTERVDFTPDR